MPHINHATAQRALAAAREHDLDIPAAVADAERAADVLRHAGHAPNSPSVPADPQAMRQTLAEHADAIQHARATGRAAADLARHVQPMLVRVIAEQTPDWIDQLAAQFTDALDQLADTFADVPADASTDNLHKLRAPAFSAWQRAAGFAHHLDQLVHARNVIASAGGEEGCRDRDLWAVVELPPVGNGRDFTHTHAPVLRAWRDNRRYAVTRWRALIEHEPFTLALAPLGHVAERVEQWQAWSHRAQRRHQWMLGPAR